MSLTTYSLEYAKSNRATCKACKVKIDKDVLRVGTTAPGPGDYDMTSWRHLACQKIPKAMTSLASLTGLASLQAEDQAKVEAWFASASAPKDKSVGGTKRKAGDGDGNADASSSGASLSATVPAAIGDPKKMKVGELKAACTAYGLPATGKKGDLVQSLNEVVQRQSLEAKYEQMSGTELKAMLALNCQIKSGTKAELVERCVDGSLYGALPRCSLCGGGTLRVHYDTKYGHGGMGRFGCPGYYDDDQFVRCKFSGTEVTRNPWKDAAAVVLP